MTQSLIILFTFLHILQEAIFFLKWLLSECILIQSVDPILLGICFHWLFSMVVVLSSKQPYTQTFEDIFDHFFRKKFIDGIRGSKAVYNLKISYTYRLPDGLNTCNFLSAACEIVLVTTLELSKADCSVPLWLLRIFPSKQSNERNSILHNMLLFTAGPTPSPWLALLSSPSGWVLRIQGSFAHVSLGLLSPSSTLLVHLDGAWVSLEVCARCMNSDSLLSTVTPPWTCLMLSDLGS